MSRRIAPTRTIDEIVITDELLQRSSRAPDAVAENRALGALARALADDPAALLDRLVEEAALLCQADSAGVSILERKGDREIFRWKAVAGQFATNLGGYLPRHASPCGTVLDRNEPVLFREPALFFAEIRDVHPYVHEALLVPFHVEGRAAGTLWVIAHSEEHRFQAEDARVLAILSRFASAAYTLLERGRLVDEVRQARRAALNLMEDAVHARRESEESHAALRGSEEKLRLVVESAREYAIFTTDLEMKVTSWNSGAERILGFPESEIMGRSSDVIFTPEDRAANRPAIERELALTEGRASDERWHRRKDGTRFWSNGFLMAMHDGDEQAVGFVKILRDETERQQTRQDLEESQKNLEETLHAKDQFLAVLSHELRTPLTPVVMAVEMMLERPGLTGQLRKMLEMIRRNVRIEVKLIDDLLDVTRISRGKLSIDPEKIDLHEIIRSAAEITKADLEAKEHELVLNLAAPSAELMGDEKMLRQVIWNLLKNASKFTDPGGRIEVRTECDERTFRVLVTDTGLGIDPSELPKVFAIFEQANPDVIKKFGGLGLGLAISKATVDAHGGTIQAASDGRRKGSTFTIELPIQGGP